MSSKGLCNCRALSQIMFNTGENCEAIPSRSFIVGLSNTNGFHIPDRVTRPMLLVFALFWGQLKFYSVGKIIFEN